MKITQNATKIEGRKTDYRRSGLKLSKWTKWEREKTTTIKGDNENKESLSEGSGSGGGEPWESWGHFLSLRYGGNERMSSLYKNRDSSVTQEKQVPIDTRKKKGYFINSIFGNLWSTKMTNFSALWISFIEKDNLQTGDGKEQIEQTEPNHSTERDETKIRVVIIHF